MIHKDTKQDKRETNRYGRINFRYTHIFSEICNQYFTRVKHVGNQTRTHEKTQQN